ncbi:MAG: hypothetical protein FWE54_03940 [Methanimicrococcus sp.]|nr:hypothetical protein [Methanimicrococcus sp.]
MKAEADFTFKTEPELITVIYKSLLPETNESISDRSVITLTAETDTLILKIVSNDIISLRSALNTWLRLIQTAYDTAASVAA